VDLMTAMARHYEATGELSSTVDVARGLKKLGYRCFEYRARALVVVNGPEIHVFVAPEWRGRTVNRKACADVFGPIFKRFGYVTTRTAIDEDPGRVDFIKRLGFKPTWSDGAFQFYMMTQLPFMKKVTP